MAKKKKAPKPAPSALWEPKEATPFDPNVHFMAEVHLLRGKFLPYKRKYTNLTPDQLQELILVAKHNHWEALDLSSCGLNKLPDELWTLTDLRILYLGASDFNSSVGTCNRILQLPRGIEKLINLKYLCFWNCGLNSVEGSRPLELPNLQHLLIFSSGFSEIPKAFAIPSLQELDLSYSPIHELPSWISCMSNLDNLDLSNTGIQSLPTSIAKLTNLRYLNIRDTPLAKKLPAELLKQDAQEIIRYVLQMQGDAPQEFFNEAKLILVGQPQVGKSSLMKRLVHDTYTGQPSTEGIDIEPWRFSQGKEDYRLNVWDFGGQEIYHATHQFFLTRRSVYLLVWDALSEDEYGRIDYWLRTIQSFADDSPIFIVVNKCDSDNGRRKRLYLEDYQDRYPQVKKIYEVSCRDNIGIDELRRDIQACAISLDVMKTPWLSAWLHVRQKLEDLAKKLNHITYGAYEDICKEHGLTPEDALSLAKYLHDLGVILYYHNDLLLRDLVILSSEWGTDAVYKILDEQERHLKDRNGILHPGKDLGQIWTDRDRYPRSYYPHLLNLMENFQLTFPIENGDYLVAELLADKAISLDLPFDHDNTLRFRYDYDFMPAGVMTRFIVAANEYLEIREGVRQCWKKGTYLCSGSAYALVQLFDAPPNRHIMIQISGPDPRDRQELLTLIRKNLDKVNDLFHKITITRRIPCICRPCCPTLFGYEDLLRAERKGKHTVECQNSWEDVDLRKLMDGVEFDMSRDFDKYIHNEIKIENNPVFNNNNNNTNTTSVSVSLEIRDLINGLHECINDLRTETDDPELTQSCENISNVLEGLDDCQTEDEVKRSGVLKKLARFLRECADPESNTGKLLAGIKYAKDIVLDLGRKYNSLAILLGAPSIPLIGS